MQQRELFTLRGRRAAAQRQKGAGGGGQKGAGGGQKGAGGGQKGAGGGGRGNLVLHRSSPRRGCLGGETRVRRTEGFFPSKLKGSSRF